jgi:hypothetical protein
MISCEVTLACGTGAWELRTDLIVVWIVSCKSDVILSRVYTSSSLVCDCHIA